VREQYWQWYFPDALNRIAYVTLIQVLISLLNLLEDVVEEEDEGPAFNIGVSSLPPKAE